MSKFVFVGSEAEILGKDAHKFENLSAHELPDELADHASKCGVLLVPESECKLTAEEMEKYPNRIAQQEAPQDFKDKLKAAILQAVARGEALLNPSSAPKSEQKVVNNADNV